VRVLVTGGAGFIGSNFVRRTLETRPGVEIVVLDALTYAGSLSNLEGLDGKYEFAHGNILNVELVDQLVSKVDLVVHFAAESHNDNSLKSAKPFVETNVMGTFELIQACVKHGVRFHHISTDEVFGDLPLNSTEKFTPETAYNPSSPYSASKAASDLLVRAWVRSFGLRATISNCSNNFGPYQHEEKLIPRMIKLIAGGQKPELYGNGLNVRDWIHVDEHNDGVWAIVDRGQMGKTYLLGAGNEKSNLEVVQTLLGLLGKPQDWIDFIADRPGHDLRYAIDASETESELDWRPERGNFEKRLAEVVPFYLKRFGR
jgi:dTDP-glucose 4,6-dehydratase